MELPPLLDETGGYQMTESRAKSQTEWEIELQTNSETK